MTERSRGGVMVRRVLAACLGWAFAAGLYLLLIDITSLPELIVGAGAAVLAAAAFELAREQEIGQLCTRARWLARAHRPLRKTPGDIITVSLAALRQLRHPQATVGEFRAVPFRVGDQAQLEVGKRALAESLGSFAPNTIVVGVDEERELILGHQLRRSGGAEAIQSTGAGMNEWQIAATVLGFALIPCVAVVLLAPPTHGLAALQVAAVLVSTILILLSEGFHRQPFIDLAVVFAPLSLVGSLTFARLMERDL